MSEQSAREWAGKQAEIVRPDCIEVLRKIANIATETRLGLEREDWSALEQDRRLDQLAQLLQQVGAGVALLVLLEDEELLGREEES